MAEPNLPPALQLKALLASYPKLMDESPSSWFVWSNNDHIEPKAWTASICHADMRYTPKGYDHLVTAAPKADKTSLKYLRMMIHGPFKAFSDLITLARAGKDQYYLQCSNLEKWPAPVLYNFCVASRYPIEFQNILDGWVDLLDDGYPELLAFLLSHSTGGEKFKGKREFPESGHHWLDPSSDWRKILAGHPDLTGANYKENPTAVTPCNAIWGKTDDCYAIRKLDDKAAAEFFGFKHPPKPTKRPIPKMDEVKWKAMNWDMEANPAPVFQPAALAPGAIQAAMDQLNQIQMQHAPNGAWAQVHQAIHDEVAVAQPVAQPFVHDDDDFPEPDFDEFPDYEDDDD